MVPVIVPGTAGVAGDVAYIVTIELALVPQLLTALTL